ncbi:MAG: Rpn family recombination-promoting nuclease/putative transposase [Coprobacillus sp.]
MEKTLVKEPSYSYYGLSEVVMANEAKRIVCSDVFFHHLMRECDEVRLLLCQSLINSHLIVETSLENTNYFHEKSGGKTVILDIVAKDDCGYFYNIEMQVGVMDENNFVRFQSYAHKLLEKQEYKGVKYVHIRDVYQLVICDKLVKELDQYQHDFHMYDDKNKVSLPYHKVNIRFIQLPLIHRRIKEGDINPIDEVMYLLSTGKKYKDNGCREVDIMMDEFIKYAQSDRFLGDYFMMSREIVERTIRDDAKEAGKEEGIKEAEVKWKYEILQKQLMLKYGEKCSWLNDCLIEQLNKVSELIVTDISLDDLKKKVLSE